MIVFKNDNVFLFTQALVGVLSTKEAPTVHERQLLEMINEYCEECIPETVEAQLDQLAAGGLTNSEEIIDTLIDEDELVDYVKDRLLVHHMVDVEIDYDKKAVTLSWKEDPKK